MKNKLIDRKMIDDTKKNLMAGTKMPPVIALQDGTVLDGAHRVIAARELGIGIPVIYLNIPIVFADPNDLYTWMDKD